jgi:hypothetical protein
MNLDLQFAGATLGQARAVHSTRQDGTESWHVTLALQAPTAAGRDALLAALHARVGTTGDLRLLEGTQTVRELATADCDYGPVLESVEARDDQPGEAQGTLHVKLRFVGRLQSGLPGGVSDGHYTVTDTVESDGTRTRTTAGFFVGPGALAQANALRPTQPERVELKRDEFHARVDFKFVELLAEGELAAFAESVTFHTARRVVDHPLLGPGLPAWRQEIGAPQTTVIQQGEATGVSEHPQAPQPRYPALLLEREVTYSLPTAGFHTRWRYLMRGTGPLPATPETP